MKYGVHRIFGRMAGRARFQPFFTHLHRTALAGMNIGSGGDVRSSGERGILTCLPAKALVLDVGGNIGSYSELVLSVVPFVRLHTFEPSVVAFNTLRANIRDRACLHPYGLGERDEEVQLFAPEQGSPMGSVFARRHHSAEWHPVEKVRLRRLDDVCAEEGIDHVDLLKIDTEGNELAVLAGATRMLNEQKVARVQFEFGGTNIDARTYLRDFVDVLAHFDLYRIVRDGVVPVRYDERWEVFTTTNFLAVRSPVVRSSARGMSPP